MLAVALFASGFVACDLPGVGPTLWFAGLLFAALTAFVVIISVRDLFLPAWDREFAEASQKEAAVAAVTEQATLVRIVKSERVDLMLRLSCEWRKVIGARWKCTAGAHE